MADFDSTTGFSAPISLLDELARLVCAYESFYLLALVEDGQSAPVLCELNNRLRSIVDGLDSMGLLS